MPSSLKYRRRQVYLGVFVLILSVFSVAEGIYFRAQDQQQRECFASAFSDLSQVIGFRAKLVDREADNTHRIISRVFEATTRKEARDAYRDYVVEENSIERARERNPVPPFPEGTCD